MSLFPKENQKREDDEDFILYEIYVLSETNRSEIETSKTVLEQLKNQLLQKVKVEAKDYIWQKDPFKLKISTDKPENPCHLKGKTYVGDYIEDEWFIVWILFGISKQYSNLLIRYKTTNC